RRCGGALAPGELAREDEVRAPGRRAVRREPRREVQVRVPVDRAVAQELGVLQPRDHAEDAALLARAEPGLETDEVPHLPAPVLAPELEHGVRLPSGPRVREPDRAHRPESERVDAARGHDLDGEAPLKEADAGGDGAPGQTRRPGSGSRRGAGIRSRAVLIEADVLPLVARVDVGLAERRDEGLVLLAA